MCMMRRVIFGRVGGAAGSRILAGAAHLGWRRDDAHVEPADLAVADLGQDGRHQGVLVVLCHDDAGLGCGRAAVVVPGHFRIGGGAGIGDGLQFGRDVGDEIVAGGDLLEHHLGGVVEIIGQERLQVGCIQCVHHAGIGAQSVFFGELHGGFLRNGIRVMTGMVAFWRAGLRHVMVAFENNGVQPAMTVPQHIGVRQVVPACAINYSSASFSALFINSLVIRKSV